MARPPLSNEIESSSLAPISTFLIIASGNSIHLTDEDTQKRTWAIDTPMRKHIWIHGEAEEELEHNTFGDLLVPIEDNQSNILEKTIIGIDRALKMYPNTRIVIRTNVSSYFRVDAIRELKFFMNEDPVIGGFLDFHKTTYEKQLIDKRFISGAGIFMNFKAAKLLLDLNPTDYRGIPDDVAISHYFLSNGVKCFTISRCNLNLTGIFTVKGYYRLKSSLHSDITSARMNLLGKFFSEVMFHKKLRCLVNIYAFELAYLFKSRPRRVEWIRNIGHIMKIFWLNRYWRLKELKNL